MSLHYLGKREPRKLGLFGHAQKRHCFGLLCNFDTHQPILIYFVDKLSNSIIHCSKYPYITTGILWRVFHILTKPVP